jgi:hypothetical protein
MTRDDTKYKWFSVHIDVQGIPVRAEYVPVSFHVDFDAILSRLGGRGTVDERTLKLYRIEPDGREIEEPVQFSPDPQRHHPERHLHPGTPASVSWAGDWPADETPSDLNAAGTLTWIARGTPSGVCRYKLLFGVPCNGVFVQVPFPPGNLRHFDAEGQPTPARWFPRMQIRPQWPLEGVVHVLRDEALLTSYHIGPTEDTASAAHRPYFYPVNGPDAVSLTELGKPHDPTGSHAHHYSLWIAHADVGGSDFWSERGGLIRHEQFELMEDGPIFARLIQRTRWEEQGRGDKETANTPQSIRLRGLRHLTFYAAPEGFRLIDVDLELSPGGSAPVELGKTPFGFLAARAAQSMTVFDGSGEIINSLGQRNEQGAHWQRAQWIDQSGPIASEKWGGIALFDHPDNPGHPTAWHCRNDGWAGAAFNLDRAWTIEPDAPLLLRYRIHLHRRDATAGEVERRYEEYTCKPAVEFLGLQS